MYYRARWFDPEISHFTAADRLVPDAYDPLSWDRYLYVRGNSIINIDPTGHTCLIFSGGQCNVYESGNIPGDIENYIDSVAIPAPISAPPNEIADDPVELIARALLGEEPNKLLNGFVDDAIGVAWAIRNRHDKLYSDEKKYPKCSGKEWLCAANSEIYGLRTDRAMDPMNHWKNHWASQDEMLKAYRKAREIAKTVLRADPSNDITHGAQRWYDAIAHDGRTPVIQVITLPSGASIKTCINCYPLIRTHFDDWNPNTPGWCVSTVKTCTWE